MVHLHKGIYLAVKKKEITKFEGKLTDLENRKNPAWGNPDPKWQILYFHSIQMLGFKLWMYVLYSK